MARRKQKISQYKGRYYRNLGKVVNDRGVVASKKFLLGRDPTAAEVANRRLEQLWDIVVKAHERDVAWKREMGGRLGIPDGVRGRRRTALRNLAHGPVWLPESLDVAEAIRSGRHEVVVEVGDTTSGEEYVERIAALRREYPIIAFTPESPELYTAGQAGLRHQSTELVEQAQATAHLADAPLPEVGGPTLYQALDAYGEYAQRRNTKEFGQREAASAARLKAAHPDVTLTQFGVSSLERIAAYWANRPVARKTGKPIALSTVRNQLKTARRFIRWLHRTDLFNWSRTVDADEALRVDVDRLRNDEEMASLRNGVPVWKVEELVTLYRYATDQERLLILLGLNAGFAQAEICSLRRDEIDRTTAQVMIKRIRRKNHVYGEFVLWKETVAAIDWFVAQRHSPPDAEQPLLFVTRKGQPFNRQRIANIWNKLLDRVQQDIPGFRRLSFKYLRKTSSQMIRDHSDGEIAAVFLCHGRAVRTDDLADDYTNRPFAKVEKALELIRGDLQPMFDAGAEAFLKPQPGGSPNISRKTIENIKALRAQGVNATTIARLLKVSRATVHRWSARDSGVAENDASLTSSAPDDGSPVADP